MYSLGVVTPLCAPRVIDFSSPVSVFFSTAVPSGFPVMTLLFEYPLDFHVPSACASTFSGEDESLLRSTLHVPSALTRVFVCEEETFSILSQDPSALIVIS